MRNSISLQVLLSKKFFSAKRSRHDDDLWNEQHQHNRYPQRDYSPPSLRPQRTLSSVIMSSTSGASTIETKSRTAVITEKKKSETKEDAVRFDLYRVFNSEVFFLGTDVFFPIFW